MIRIMSYLRNWVNQVSFLLPVCPIDHMSYNRNLLEVYFNSGGISPSHTKWIILFYDASVL